MSSAFAVKIGDFEGPLDLLLNLIEERKMLISDVSLTGVADDFLKYIENQTSFPLGQAAHFVLVAATLLLLKSRALLPVLTLSLEEEGDIKDLEFRLSLYQVFRNTAREFGKYSKHIFFGNGAKVVSPLFVPPPDLSLENLAAAAVRVLSEAPQQTLTHEVAVKPVISLEDMMERLSKRIEQAMHMTFTDFAGTDAAGKHEIVVGFLAMLELVKRGLMLAEQDRLLGEIRMDYNGSMKAPRYD